MAGFEIVVRPVVFPNIRPTPARSLPPEDDPTKGICEITGKGSHPLQLTSGMSVSTSKSKPVETERRVDEVRVYQEEDDGTVNRDNFVDLQVANRITYEMPPAAPPAAPPAPAGPGQPIGGPGGPVLVPDIYYYRRAQETANVEVKKRDVIIHTYTPTDI